MSLFQHDDKQDARLDALEQHIRGLSQLVQQSQMDIASVNITLLSLQRQLAEKLSTNELDPSFQVLNDEIKTTRADLERVSEAAADAWEPLQAGVTKSLSVLRDQIEQLKVNE